MSTKITTVYDAFRSTLATLFPNKKDIPNPYSIEDNDQHVIADAYGLKVSNIVTADIDILKESTVSYVFTVVLARELVRVDSDTDILPTQTKALLEDEVIIRKDFLNADQLNVATSVARIDYVTASGVQFFKKGNKHNFISLEIDFNVDIFETI